ncbi:MAG: GNAT family N-acetyltransferase [Gammaproteobacteria bacterium]|nr:GNAT family N-acetyltransferase [Gammaproteobacteria bacterium]
MGEEWDGRDDDSRHFLAESDGKPIGTARLLAAGQIGRMAVLQRARGLGIGRLLLDAAVTAAREGDYPEIFLEAQTHAVEFYRKAGFRPEGPTFMEAGIPHQRMTLD